jgi:hypothetical protein
VDLIGPWIVQVRGIPHQFDALTAIDTVTNLVEIVRIDSKESDHIARKFAQCWLTRYPGPQRCIHGKIAISEMSVLQLKIHNPMLCAKECTKQ